MSLPALKVQIQGQTVISADNANTYAQWCSSAAQLRAFIGLPNMEVRLQGISAIDDGGQGDFVWYATVTESDDNLNYIVPLGANGGGWVRQGALLPIPVITGALSSVSDPNAKAVLTSIIAAMVALNLATNGTT